MEFLNYILDKVEPIKNAADLLILILMGVCSVHSVKDSREKAAESSSDCCSRTDWNFCCKLCF